MGKIGCQVIDVGDRPAILQADSIPPGNSGADFLRRRAASVRLRDVDAMYREREVLLLAAMGHTNREIAQIFHLSE